MASDNQVDANSKGQAARNQRLAKLARKNKRYLECIPRTLGYVKKTFGRHPELSALQKSLGKIIPELIS